MFSFELNALSTPRMKNISTDQEIRRSPHTPPVIENGETVTPSRHPGLNNPSLKLLALISVGAILLTVIHLTSLGEQFCNEDFLAELLNEGNQAARLYFVFISSFLIMLGTPRLFFYALGGYAFGFWEGLLWSLCGSLAGSFIAFRSARWGGRDWLAERFKRRRLIERIIHAKPTILSVALIRMLPVSNILINCGLALSQTGSRAFLLGSLFGFLPQGILFVLIGTGLSKSDYWCSAI